MHVASNLYVATVSLIIDVKQHHHIDNCCITEADIWAGSDDGGAGGMGFVIQDTCGGIDSSNRTLHVYS